MRARKPLTIDMTPSGEFRPDPAGPALPVKIGFWAMLLAVGATAMAVGALFLWVASLLVPLAVGAALIAYLAFRFQLWRAGKRPAAYRR